METIKTFRIEDGVVKQHEYDTKETKLEVSIGYELGGMNWFNGEHNNRGYYLYVEPQLDRGGFIIGKGYKRLLKSVTRQSTKSLNEVKEIAKEVMNEVVNATCERYGYTLLGEM